MKRTHIAAMLALACSVAVQAQSAQTVKIASLDMLSGPMAGLGHNVLKGFQYTAQLANEQRWAGPVRFDIVAFDNKASSQETLSLLNAIVAQNIRYVVQGASSSAVGIALEEAIQKHNDRNPGQEIIYLNYASQAPVMTQAKCSYWHFRTDAHSDMKVDALTTAIADRKDVQKVYLINPNYSYGQETARAARETLGRKRQDIQIVGDDLHPSGTVKDFSPYMAKIKQSGAQVVVTSSWGGDLPLMVRAAKDSGLKVDFYTLNGNNFGVPSAMGAAGEGTVKLITTFNPNDPQPADAQLLAGFKKQFSEDFILGAGYNAIVALAQGIRQARSTDPVQVAAQLSGMTFQGFNGPVTLRKSDHQAQQQVYVQSWEKLDGKSVVHDQENTGFGWKTTTVVSAQTAELPTTCRMKRP